MINKEISTKTISFSIQTAKMTSDTLKNMLNDFLSKPQNYHGQKVTYGNLAKQGKLDNIEITENNIGDFVKTARKYDIDYALKRDRSTSPPTYYVFFSSGKSQNFTKAFSEYAGKMQQKLSKKHLGKEAIQKSSVLIRQNYANKSQEKHLSKSSISGR